MSDTPVVLTDAPTEADRSAVSTGLARFSEEAAGFRDYRPVAALVKDPVTFETVGGMYGRTSYGTLIIDLVFLPARLRGKDLGAKLLGIMEAEAVARGCRNGFLMTASFQAPRFYARHGWEEFGRIPCEPAGSSRVFFRKTFRTEPDGAVESAGKNPDADARG